MSRQVQPDRGELAAAGVAILVGAAAVVKASSFPRVGGLLGPALFPIIIGAGLVLSGAALAVQALTRARAVEAHGGGESREKAPGESKGRIVVLPRLIAVVATVVYMVIVDRAGFLVSATFIMLALMLLMGVRFRVALPVSVGTAVAIYLLFARLLLVPLPGGILI